MVLRKEESIAKKSYTISLYKTILAGGFCRINYRVADSVILSTFQ